MFFLPFSARLSPGGTERRSGVLRIWSRLAVVCLCVALGGHLRCAAQAPAGNAKQKDQQYFFDAFGTEQGLPHTVVLAALQTRDGYLWVGTESGLARFDGVRFESFRASNTPALTNNLVHCLYEDRAGTLWVGTEEGLICYRNGVFEKSAVQNVPVRALAEDRGGKLWIGTYGHGLQSLHAGVVSSFEHDTAMLSPFVLSVLVDSTDRVWAGFEKAQGVVYGENGSFRRYDGGRIDGDIQTICEQPSGTLWFGSRNHRLYRVKGNAVSRYYQVHGVARSQIYGLRPARDGGLWVAAGILQKVTDLENFAITSVSWLPSEDIVAIFEDREGSVWLCARDGGLIRSRQMPFRSITTNDGLPGSGTRTVSEDTSGNLWLAMQGRNVTKVAPDGAVSIYAANEGMPLSPWVVYAARDGSVWAGFHYSLRVLRDGQWQAFPEIAGVFGIYEDRHGVIWLGTEKGIVSYKDGQFTPLPVDIDHTITHASAFCEGPDGALYIGIWDAGILKVQDGRVTVLDRRGGLPTDDVRALYVDRENHLWVGLRSRGLAVLADGHWYNPNALSESLADHATAIAEDDRGQLWVGTAAGVMWAPKNELLAAARGERPMPKMHIAELGDGFRTAAVWSGPQPTVWKTRDRKLVFATRRGVLKIDPEHLPANSVSPPVLIEKTIVDREVTLAPTEIRLPAGARELTIEYTALSFVQPNRVLFKYRLEGYEEEWVEAGIRRAAFYTNLSPGRYVFHVLACNSDGVWNETGARLSIVQQPHFYQTLWFYVSVVVTGAGLALGIYRRRTAALRRENEKLNLLVAERTQELVLSNTAKTEFLESVSHEIRNPLHGLNGLMTMLKQESLGARARELMDSVQSCAQSLSRVFEEVLGHTKLEHGDITLHETSFSLRGLLRDIEHSFAWQASQNGNRIEVKPATDFIDGFIGDENKIKTIIGNFVANAIKYAPGSPIELRAESHPAGADLFDVHIEVCDRGPGLPPDEQKLIFRKFVRGSNAKQSSVAGTGLGLATCRALAHALKGNVGVDCEAGEGAVFFLRVPLLRAVEPESGVDPDARGDAGAVLIVEDEHYNQIVLRGIALELGYAPEVASNAEQADALLERKKFVAIFLDWELPGAKGGDIARRARARPRGEKPVIIATTAHDSEEIRRQCREAGMDEFLPKPYDAAQVRRRIAAVLARRQSPPATPAVAPVATSSHGLNLRAFELYARGAPGQAGEASGRFAEAIDEELAQLERALQKGDATPVAEAAHRLHALAGLIGATSLAAAAKKLEQWPGQTTTEQRREYFQELLAAAAALKEEICAMPSGSGPRA